MLAVDAEDDALNKLIFKFLDEGDGLWQALKNRANELKEEAGSTNLAESGVDPWDFYYQSRSYEIFNVGKC